MKGGGNLAIHSALVVTRGEQSAASLAELLRQIGILHVEIVPSAEAAEARVQTAVPDLCIINAPLYNASGEALAGKIARDGHCEVFLLIKAELTEAVENRLRGLGVFILAKPVNKPLFQGAVRLAQAAKDRRDALLQENKRLQQKIEDIRIVDRAKYLLISYLSMTEPEAHRYLEKQAMDMRITKRAAAEEILKTYEG